MRSNLDRFSVLGARAVTIMRVGMAEGVRAQLRGLDEACDDGATAAPKKELTNAMAEGPMWGGGGGSGNGADAGGGRGWPGSARFATRHARGQRA
ncbi:hypothetical protein FGB62_21g35 [Gracilaria domingensis]|nr:hypothetical protein FGB62_21g35 [Gracilaria domingensis]